MWDLLVVSRWRHCCHWRQLIGYCCTCVVTFRNVKFLTVVWEWATNLAQFPKPAASEDVGVRPWLHVHKLSAWYAKSQKVPTGLLSLWSCQLGWWKEPLCEFAGKTMTTDWAVLWKFIYSYIASGSSFVCHLNSVMSCNFSELGGV
jgi:hypothetical protein